MPWPRKKSRLLSGEHATRARRDGELRRLGNQRDDADHVACAVLDREVVRAGHVVVGHVEVEVGGDQREASPCRAAVSVAGGPRVMGEN
jgi:hypothetical protein